MALRSAFGPDSTISGSCSTKIATTGFAVGGLETPLLDPQSHFFESNVGLKDDIIAVKLGGDVRLGPRSGGGDNKKGNIRILDSIAAFSRSALLYFSNSRLDKLLRR